MDTIRNNAINLGGHNKYFGTIKSNFVYTVRKFTYRIESKFYSTKFFTKYGFYDTYNSISDYSHSKENIMKHANNNEYYDFFSRVSAYAKYLKKYK